jgi:hypothetical protein
MEFMIRPFRRVIECIPPERASDVTGGIDAGVFAFSVDGAHFTIPTLSCGQDKDGQFAVSKESEQILDHGFRLAAVVELPDYPDGPLGCSICLSKPDPALAAIQNHHPGEIVLGPPEAALSIEFRVDGTVCGCGGVFDTRYDPAAPPAETMH